MREGIYVNHQDWKTKPCDGFVIFFRGGYQVAAFTDCTWPFIEPHAAALGVSGPVFVCTTEEVITALDDDLDGDAACESLREAFAADRAAAQAAREADARLVASGDWREETVGTPPDAASTFNLYHDDTLVGRVWYGRGRWGGACASVNGEWVTYPGGIWDGCGHDATFAWARLRAWVARTVELHTEGTA